MRPGWMLALLLGLGCADPPEEEPCGALPEPSACPTRGGGSCTDRSCTALYGCHSGSWTLVERCEASGGAAGATAQGGASGSAGSAAGQAGAACTPSPVDDPGACPPLAAPDCNVALVEQCPEQACQLGCEGFLRCEQGDWSERYVAYCSDDGELIKP